MNGDPYTVLRAAIVAKRQVACVYQGHTREVCPHVIGLKVGRRQVLSFQFGGTSSSGLPPEGQWRCMIVDQIESATSRDGPWHTSLTHTQTQTCVDDIDVEVDF